MRILQENGRYGVGVFFLISGFLICTLLLREEQSTGRLDVWKFYARRALRLLPLYYVLLLLQCVLVFGLHQYTPENQQLFRANLPSYLFYYSNWLPSSSRGPFFCAWSLAAEEQFYLLFALLLCFAPRRFLLPTIVMTLLVKFAAYLVFGALDANSAVWRVLLSYQEPILIGVLLGFALNSNRGYSRVSRWLGSGWVTIASAVLACLWLMAHSIRQESGWDAELLYLLSAVILVGLVTRAEVPLLTGIGLVYIGRISYGMYLLHAFIFAAANRLSRSPHFFVIVIGTISLTIFLASLSYKYFEQPLTRRFKKRLSSFPCDGSGNRLSQRAPQTAPSSLLN